MPPPRFLALNSDLFFRKSAHVHYVRLYLLRTLTASHFPGKPYHERSSLQNKRSLTGGAKPEVTFPRFFVFQQAGFMLPVFPSVEPSANHA